MFKFLANIFGYVLNFIYGLVNNYGLAIIIFTILLRLILLPINLKQQKTMKKTAKVQEKMKDIQDKYSNDPVRLNEEIKNLYAEEHVNPFSGCLSSIFQIIIVISMFYLVSHPLTYMKHIPTKKINEYTKIVKEENSGQNVNYIEIAIIKSLGKKEKDVYINMDFLGLDLSDIPSKNYDDPRVFIIPVLYVTTSILSMKLNTAMIEDKKKKKEEAIKAEKEDEKLVKVEKKKDEEEAMASMTKSMKYMMPIMTVSIAMIAPLGLALYWFVSNLIMICERLLVNKFVKEEE